MSAARRTRRQRRWGREPGSGIPPAFMWAIGVGALVGAGFSISAFVEGKPMTGRTGSGRARDAWEAYGDGAFAADSAIHLLLAIGLLVLAVLTMVTALRREQYLQRLAPIALLALAAGAVASLTLLIVSAASGVPFRNFQSLGQLEGAMYPLVMLIPLVVLTGVALGARELLKRRRARRAESGL